MIFYDDFFGNYGGCDTFGGNCTNNSKCTKKNSETMLLDVDRGVGSDSDCKIYYAFRRDVMTWMFSEVIYGM